MSGGAPLDSAAPEECGGQRPDAANGKLFAVDRLTIALMAIALLAGGYLRFANLDEREMSADEGASWAAASAPTIHAVLVAQSNLNPGKAGLHDLVLHLWMCALGSGLAAMRALSATVGTLAIVLVFGAARELFAAGCAAGVGEGPSMNERNQAAAIAALVFAANLVAIKYSREVRMYPIVIAAVVAQTWCFFRAMRTGGFAAYAGAAIFTAMATAAHVMAAPAFSGEGLWLAIVIARNRRDLAAVEVRRAIALLIALGAGAAMLLAVAPAMFGRAAHAASLGAIDWITRPPPWAPFALFNKATGSAAFPVMVALALWGVVRGWPRWREAIVFALLWMWMPPIVLMFVSYAIRPVFVERYLVSCFVPFFILVAIGIVEVRPYFARVAAVALAVVLAIAHVAAWDRKPHDTQWREAVMVAETSLAAGSTGNFAALGNANPARSSAATLAVAPRYAVNVVRYYLTEISAAQVAHPAELGDDDAAAVVVIGDQGVTALTRAVLDREYPRPLANLRGVVVRGR